MICHQKIIVLAKIQPFIWHWFTVSLTMFFILKYSYFPLGPYFRSSLFYWPLSSTYFEWSVFKTGSKFELVPNVWEPGIRWETLSWIQVWTCWTFVFFLPTHVHCLHSTADWVVWRFASWALGEGWALAWWLLVMITGSRECALSCGVVSDKSWTGCSLSRVRGLRHVWK